MKYKVLLIFLLITVAAQAQEEPPRKTTFGGYIKYLQTLNVTYGLDSLLDNHLLHNRFNFSWFPNDHWTIRAEMRNRIFYGDYVEDIPYYDQLVDVNNDQFDLSAWIIDERSFKMLSELDRAYVRYTYQNLEVTAGRQRINWGINTVWNPNDIFNAYSFFDFDYEERPGSDAISIAYHYGFASKVEIASKISSNFEDYTGAFLWKINESGYDVQLLTGVMENNVVMGTGWAGYISTAGFKGEITYFSAIEPLDNDALVGTVSLDYIFNSGAYLLGSYFYNSAGVKDLNLATLAVVSSTKPLNAKNLLPFNTAVFTSYSQPISPLLTANLAIMWFPGNNSGYLGPSLVYNAADNVTLDFNSQIFTVESEKLIDPVSFQLFFRGRWSF